MNIKERTFCHKSQGKKPKDGIHETVHIFVFVILTEGASVKVHPGGNTTLPCNIKDDTEITWIIINGNHTFVRILKLEYLKGTESKPVPSNIHPSYAGRIKSLSSPTNTHSLLLMNISDTDLMLYCCTEHRLEQTHCTKLDFEGDVEASIEDVEQQDTKTIIHESVIMNIFPWMPVVCVLLLLLLMSNVCVCWRATGLQKGCARTIDPHQNWIHNSVQDEMDRDDWTMAEVLYTPQ